jgi:hypothetical protein
MVCQDHLKRMIVHSKSLSCTRAIHQDNQFDYLLAGSMIGLGSCEPAGRASGNAYRVYEGMSAFSLDDIGLFNHAEVPFLLI